MLATVKRVPSEIDVLDLSQRSFSPNSQILIHDDESSSSMDVIVLSEDEEDKNTPLTSDTEKENTPFGEKLSSAKALLIRLENELRNEESTLVLLQKLRDSQRSISSPTSAKNVAKSAVSTLHNPSANAALAESANVPLQNVPNASQLAPKSVSASTVAAAAKVQPVVTQSNLIATTPKVTKAAALQSLEQQCNARKSVLRKQLERNLEKVSLPRPTSGTGLCEVSFIPSTLTTEFTSLLGLEEVVRTIQDFDPSAISKPPESRRSFNPFSCVKCGIDFTPVWKREKPGSNNVICEECLAGNQRVDLQMDYEESVKQALQSYASSEREVEREYQDVVTTPAKLESYIREQEKKLLATQQAQLAQHQQQQIAQQQVVSQAQGQRYHSKQNTGTVSNIRPQTLPPTAVLASSTNSSSHQRSRQATTTPLSNLPVTPTAHVALPHQHASAASLQLASQFQQQQQQFTKSAVAGTSPSVNTTPLMMANAANPTILTAAANSQQQQQQRLIAAVLSGLQQPLQQTPSPAIASDQFTQMQALIMNSILLGGTQAANQTPATSRQQLIQQAIQYNLLLQQQQQQQQAAAAQQAQQVAAAQQAQQNAVISQLLAAIHTNPNAYLALIQNILALNAANNSTGGGASGNKK